MSIPLNYFSRGALGVRSASPIFWTALVTAVCTFPLIFMGGLVTSHGAGMSVPDWPNSYGYNMFLFPPSQWIGGIFYEHTHRLMGTLVGFSSIVLVLLAWGVSRNATARRIFAWTASASTLVTIAIGIAIPLLQAESKLYAMAPHLMVGTGSLALIALAAFFCRNPEPRRWVRWLAVTVLVTVCTQGLMGGLRVTEVNLTLAIIHGCFAQAYFCLTVFMVMVTSRWWKDRPSPQPSPGVPGEGVKHGQVARATSVISLALICVVVVYLQLIAGALMRHYQAGLAIPDIPFAYGKLLPPMTQDELRVITWQRAQENLPMVSLGQIWLHFAHRVGAVLVSILVTTLSIRILRRHRNVPILRDWAILLLGLLITQLTLGILTVLQRKPADIASFHVAAGAMILVVTFATLVAAIRLYWPSRRPQAQSTSQPAPGAKFGFAS